MRVKMLKDAPGSPDGISVQQYDKGEEYDVTEALGAAFITHGLATSVDKKSGSKASAPKENK